jgi:hypothetical protein
MLLLKPVGPHSAPGEISIIMDGMPHINDRMAGKASLIKSPKRCGR